MERVYLVADYSDRLAYTEVDVALAVVFPGVQVISTNVPPFRTEVAGFVACQIARAGLDPQRHCLLINVDGRTHTDQPLVNGEGAPFVCVTLDSGLRVFSPNAGSSLSLLKSRIVACHQLSNGNSKSQFRSRDGFPQLMARVVRGANGNFPDLALDQIPDFNPPESLVLWVDGFGNVKTSITRSQAVRLGWKSGAQIMLMVGGRGADHPVQVSCANSIMGVAPGTLVWAPGSSGNPDDPHMEFAVRSHGPGDDDCGAKRLSNPAPGDPLKVSFPHSTVQEQCDARGG